MNIRYVLTIETARDPLNREPAVRLRQLLKLAWRAFGLRCISAKELRGDWRDGEYPDGFDGYRTTPAPSPAGGEQDASWESTMREVDSANRRWSACLHEAAHLVCALRLTDGDCAAGVFRREIGGTAGLCVFRVASRVKRAVIAAAGELGEAVACATQPPHPVPARDRAEGELNRLAALAAQPDPLSSDVAAIAEWTATATVARRGREATYHDRVTRLARVILTSNRPALLAISECIYRYGAIGDAEARAVSDRAMAEAEARGELPRAWQRRRWRRLGGTPTQSAGSGASARPCSIL